MSSAKGAGTYLVLGATLLAAIQSDVAWAGIHGSSTQGIHGSSAQGIHGSSAAGIHGSSSQGIHGSSVDGIHGSSTAGIHGSSTAGIHGSSTTGIHGSSVDGIHGSSAAGIHGSSTTGIHGSSTAGIHGSSALVLAGPVDSIDPINGVFIAVGQTVMASQGMLSSMNVGDFVSVNGSVVSSGWLYADAVSVSNDMYVPGATPVFVTGIPSEIDPLLGQARLGELTIDYTAAMSGGGIPSGLSLSFRGTQPVNRGLLVSDAVSAVQ